MTTEFTHETASHPKSDQVVCSLFEDDFHQGVAALINSIVKGGFRGLFWVGYRGSLPPWTTQLKCGTDGLFQVGNARLGFEGIESKRHFSQYKPEFMRSLIDRGIARRNLWYFDPDITVRCAWSFFERWIRFGICLCQEINIGMMASDHPIRREWMHLARNAGWGEPRQIPERYYNSGFVGLQCEHREFLETWASAIHLANSSGVGRDQFQKGSRAETFYTVDQDAMNLATMYSQAPLTAIGPEGMGWVTGGFTMYHSVGSLKPWRKKFLRAALSGYPPSNGDKHFLRNVDKPIRLYPGWGIQLRQGQANLAALIGRLYHRV